MEKLNRRALFITRRADYLRLKERGRSFHVNQWLLVNYEATDRGFLRNGGTIPTYVGRAVLRNRLRRWGREFVREWRRTNVPSVDVNFVFKRRDKVLYRELTHVEFDEALRRVANRLEELVG